MAHLSKGPPRLQGRSGRGGSRAVFSQQSDHHPNTVHPSVLRQARKSGVLNLSQRGLSVVPENVWSVQEDVPEEAKSVSMDDTDDRWWETVDLTKLILASNQLNSLSEDLRKLLALTVLDVHDNSLTSLPKALGTLEHLQKLDISHNQLSELPASVGSLSNLQVLNADHNKLTSISEEVCSLAQLETLNVSNNQMEALPRYICLLLQLRSLNVSNNKLRQLPPDLGSLSCLRLLEATHNQLINLPDELGNLSKLEQLHVRHNQLEYLPVLRHCCNLKEILAGNNNIRGLTEEHLQHLTSLQCLDVRDNKIQKIPDEITLLNKLERLDLTNNDINTLPFVMGGMKSLKSLVLDGNPMRTIRRDIVMRGTNELKQFLTSRISESDQKQPERPAGTNQILAGGGDQSIKAHDLQQMKTLDYSNKKASSLPDDVVQAALEAGIKVLNLSKNQLTELPKNISVLSPKLTELKLGTNRLAQLSPDVKLFTRLQLLDLRANQLSNLPPELSAISGLRELVISNNRFTRVPPVVYSLTNLEILFVHDNRVTEIDVSGFLRLTKLGTLDLQNNDLSQIPPELGNCVWLKSLSLSGNPLRNPRAAILAKGTIAVLEYLRSRIPT